MIREYIIKISDEVMEDEIADRPPMLIRCKDCIYYHKPEIGFTTGDCTYRKAWYPVGKEEFCSLAKQKDGEPEKNCLTCRNSFSDEEDHLHCMADGHNHEEIVADGHTCKHWC